MVNIFKDSQKDIKNNWKGLQYGLENKGKCINLLEQKLPYLTIMKICENI